jgi:hypothetical protein
MKKAIIFYHVALSIHIRVGYPGASGFGLDAGYAFGSSNLNSNKNGGGIQSNIFNLAFFISSLTLTFTIINDNIRSYR